MIEIKQKHKYQPPFLAPFRGVFSSIYSGKPAFTSRFTLSDSPFTQIFTVSLPHWASLTPVNTFDEMTSARTAATMTGSINHTTCSCIKGRVSNKHQLSRKESSRKKTEGKKDIFSLWVFSGLFCGKTDVAKKKTHKKQCDWIVVQTTHKNWRKKPWKSTVFFPKSTFWLGSNVCTLHWKTNGPSPWICPRKWMGFGCAVAGNEGETRTQGVSYYLGEPGKSIKTYQKYSTISKEKLFARILWFGLRLKISTASHHLCVYFFGSPFFG